MPENSNQSQSGNSFAEFSVHQNNLVSRNKMLETFSRLRIVTHIANLKLLGLANDKLLINGKLDVNDLEVAYKYPSLDTVLSKKLQAEQHTALLNIIYLSEIDIQLKMIFFMTQEIEVQKNIDEMNFIRELDEEYSKKLMYQTELYDKSVEQRLKDILSEAIVRVEGLIVELKKLITTYKEAIEVITVQIEILKQNEELIDQSIHHIEKNMHSNIENEFNTDYSSHNVDFELSPWSLAAQEAFTRLSISPPVNITIDMSNIITGIKEKMHDKVGMHERHIKLTSKELREVFNTEADRAYFKALDGITLPTYEDNSQLLKLKKSADNILSSIEPIIRNAEINITKNNLRHHDVLSMLVEKKDIIKNQRNELELKRDEIQEKLNSCENQKHYLEENLDKLLNDDANAPLGLINDINSKAILELNLESFDLNEADLSWDLSLHLENYGFDPLLHELQVEENTTDKLMKLFNCTTMPEADEISKDDVSIKNDFEVSETHLKETAAFQPEDSASLENSVVEKSFKK